RRMAPGGTTPRVQVILVACGRPRLRVARSPGCPRCTTTRSRQKETAMLTWAGKDWMARVGPRGRALDAVRAHIAAEVDTRTDVIMSTVSADPWFPLPDRLSTGLTLSVV